MSKISKHILIKKFIAWLINYLCKSEKKKLNQNMIYICSFQPIPSHHPFIHSLNYLLFIKIKYALIVFITLIILLLKVFVCIWLIFIIFVLLLTYFNVNSVH